MHPARIIALCVTLAAAGCSQMPASPAAPLAESFTPATDDLAPPAPTATTAPTSTPVVRIEEGDVALFHGDYPAALAHYQTAYRDASEATLRAAAKWGETRALYGDGRHDEAVSAAGALISEFPNSTYVPLAYFLQGRAQLALRHYQEAADSWAAYLVLRPGVIDAHTQELRGDVLFLAEDFEGALAAYTATIQSPRLDDTASVEIKAADTRAKLQDFNTALAIYENLLGRPVNDFIKAQAAYEAGLVYEAQGRLEDATGKFRFVLGNYPLSYYSYLSLLELVDAGVAVDDMERGLADYYAGEYGGALAAFDRYLADNAINDGTAHYYRALTLRELGNYQAAVTEFGTFIQDYSTHERWAEAWGEKAYTQWYEIGLYSEAASTLLEFVTVLPDSGAAPSYLMSAARILERDDRLEEAALVWERVANEYPGSEDSSTGVFLAGISRFRLEAYEDALAAFNRSLVIATRAEDRARAYLWIGKCHVQLGDAAAATTAWQQGQITDPGGYYSERIRDLLADRLALAPGVGEIGAPDLASERADADAWMRLTFNLPEALELSSPGDLERDARFIRGNEFWELGLQEEARAEFESLREAVSANAVDSYRLANHLLDLGLYRPAIFASREVLTLAGLDEHTESMMAPPYFGHVRYGIYYTDLVMGASELEGIDPLLLLSVLRQESLFEGFVESTAGARGLMQVIPGTGVELAGELGWPVPYDDSDLYRPDVSIRFGSHYLASNRRALGGDWYAALAAYNSGPGNAVIWRDLAAGDPDLFLEVIRFDETRTYIRSIYETYLIYKRLYRSGA